MLLWLKWSTCPIQKCVHPAQKHLFFCLEVFVWLFIFHPSKIYFSFSYPTVSLNYCSQFDLREEKATKLLTCHQFGKNSGKPSRSRVVRLNVIVTHPINLNYFTVGGSDQYARVYDIRRLTANGSEMEDQPVETYAPKHLLGPGHDEHITCVAYSHQEELLVSYNDELIYLFDKSMSLGSSPHKNVEENEKEGDGGEASNQGNTQPQVYEGHRNHQTVKGVNFFGPNTEYVVSGSDCGRIFIWKKKGGKLVALMKGDDTVVNCLEPHPYATILATSGIEDTIKIWSPESERILDLPHDTDRIMRINKRRRESQANNIQLTPGLVRRLLLSRHLHMPNYNEGGTNTQVSFEGGYADDDGGVVDSDFDEDDSFEEGDIGNPRECIIS